MEWHHDSDGGEDDDDDDDDDEEEVQVGGGVSLGFVLAIEGMLGACRMVVSDTLEPH
jgi:clock-associated PAS protein ZTL